MESIIQSVYDTLDIEKNLQRGSLVESQSIDTLITRKLRLEASHEALNDLLFASQYPALYHFLHAGHVPQNSPIVTNNSMDRGNQTLFAIYTSLDLWLMQITIRRNKIWMASSGSLLGKCVVVVFQVANQTFRMTGKIFFNMSSSKLTCEITDDQLVFCSASEGETTTWTAVIHPAQKNKMLLTCTCARS